jgi:branched-chain amino acid aminotransferase
MIHRNVFHNGRLLPIEQVRLSPGQGGLLSGWGLFSTLKVIDTVPFAFDRHWKRLQKDAARTRCPFPFDPSELRAQIAQLIQANQVDQGSLRIYVIFNNVGSWRSDEKFPDVDLILYTAGLPEHREPATLALRENGRHAASPLAGVKVTSWLTNVWCLQEAREGGFDEVVLLNERGEVSECTAANIFCVQGGRVLTPPIDSGCLEGVTRALLLEMAPGAGVPAEERVLRPEDLLTADEVFISSTNRSLLGVGELAGHIYTGAPGPITQKLEQVFAGYIANYVARHKKQ